MNLLIIRAIFEPIAAQTFRTPESPIFNSPKRSSSTACMSRGRTWTKDREWPPGHCADHDWPKAARQRA